MNNRIALITGASRGIGAATAEHLSTLGYTVIGTATTKQGAEDIQSRLSQLNPAAKGYELDICDAQALEDCLKKIQTDVGKMPEILINNAGITKDNLLIRMSDDEWDAIMETNLKSVFKLSKLCLRSMMKARFGRIISIVSVVGATGNAGQSNYSAAKAAVGGFSRSLAREVGSRGITVNTIAPGFIDTDMTRALGEEQRALFIKDIPMARLGSTQDIASAVAFLASDESAYITGQTLHVNGGLFMQ